jgi:putative transcriptional regulator
MKSIKDTLFKISIPHSEPFEGALLVSEPFLEEKYFKHAVVALVEFGKDKGAMGIVMNNPIAYNLHDLLKKVDEKTNVPVYCGGPLSTDRLYFIHTLGSLFPEAREFAPGLFIGGDFDTIIDYVNSGYTTEGQVRFFVGYSGWSPGQLEEELNENVWAVTKITLTPEEMLKGKEDAYWHRIVKSMGADFKGWMYHPSDLHNN